MASSLPLTVQVNGPEGQLDEGVSPSDWPRTGRSGASTDSMACVTSSSPVSTSPFDALVSASSVSPNASASSSGPAKGIRASGGRNNSPVSSPGSSVRGRHDRRCDLAESGRDSVAQRLDLTRGATEAFALVDEEPFELIDVAEQELTAGLERLDLVGRGDPLGLAGLARLGASLFHELRRHLAGRVECGIGFGAGGGADPVGLGLGFGDRGVGGALGEQQGARDRLGLVGAHLHRCAGCVGFGCRGARCRCRVGGGRRRLLLFLESGDGGTGAGFHRRGLLLGLLECGCCVVEQGVDLGGVVSLADGAERRTADLAGRQFHAHQSSYSS